MKPLAFRSSIAALALGATLLTATTQPAKADGAASTRNIILGAAALAAGVAIASNVEHKQQLASTVEGYTRNGATVYEDGHVVSRNGRSWYPGDESRSVACGADGRCRVSSSN
jgi:hypothetical protein